MGRAYERPPQSRPDHEPPLLYYVPGAMNDEPGRGDTPDPRGWPPPRWTARNPGEASAWRPEDLQPSGRPAGPEKGRGSGRAGARGAGPPVLRPTGFRPSPVPGRPAGRPGSAAGRCPRSTA